VLSNNFGKVRLTPRPFRNKFIGNFVSPSLPDQKTLEQIDWEALAGISRQKIAELARYAFVGASEDVVIAGFIGTGKTHLAIALGVEAAVAASTCSSAIGSLKAITDCYCHLNISHFDNFFLKPHFEHSQNRK